MSRYRRPFLLMDSYRFFAMTTCGNYQRFLCYEQVKMIYHGTAQQICQPLRQMRKWSLFTSDLPLVLLHFLLNSSILTETLSAIFPTDQIKSLYFFFTALYIGFDVCTIHPLSIPLRPQRVVCGLGCQLTLSERRSSPRTGRQRMEGST